MLQKPIQCILCPLYQEGQGFAPGSGWTGRKIWLIGEALGETEALQGKPFVGGSGRILNALLAEAGIWRDECYVTNVVKCRPSQNRVPTKQEIEFCKRAYLNQELSQATEETVIVMLGATPLLALTGFDKVQKRRGSWYKCSDTKANLLSTLHPEKVIREPELWSIVVSDLKHKVKRGYQRPKETTYITNPTIGQVEKSISDILAFNHNYSLDIETSFDSVYQSSLLCIGLAYESEAICIPFSVRYWKEHERRVVRNLYELLFQTKPIVQNGLFDLLYLWLLGFSLTNPAFDTMLAHHLMYAELPHDLGFLTSVYTDMPYYKDEGKGDPKLGQVPREQLWVYNLKDIDSTLQCSVELKQELKEFGLENFYYQKVLPMVPVLIKMMAKGLNFDKNKAQSIKIPLEQTMSVLLTTMQTFVQDPTFNPLSPKQLGKVLYETFKMPVLKRTATNAPSTDEDILTKLSARFPNPLLEGIIQYRQMNKKVSTYLAPTIEIDNKVHTSFLLHGTTTGRLSSRNPNLQNVPEDLRVIYVPEPGHLFYQFDYSQIELRIMAYLSNETEWIAAVEDPNRDIHQENAMIIFQQPAENCAKGVKIKWKGKERELRKFTKNYTYCIAKGETVGTLNGDIPIQDIKPGMWTYSWDGIAYAPTKILSLHNNGSKECIKVDFTYLSGQRSSLTCTSDHKILMKDGSYKEAGQLLVDDRVMPFKRAKLCNGRYREIDPFNDGHRVYEHKWIYGMFNKLDESLYIHHIDGNGNNNIPENLSQISQQEHMGSIHKRDLPNPLRNNQHIDKTHCKRGHKFTPKNTVITTQGSRQCTTCVKLRTYKGKVQGDLEFCKWGHKYTEDNTHWTLAGYKYCKQCQRDRYYKCIIKTKNHRVEKITKIGIKNVYCITVENEAHNFPISSAGIWVGNCLMYGGGVEAVLATDPGILTIEEAKAAEFRLMSARSRVKAFRDKIKNEVLTTHKITNIFGRPRIFFGSKGNMLTSAYDYPMQSAAAQIINDAMVRIDQIEVPGMLLQVHDSLLFQLKDEEADKATSIIKREMERPVQLGSRLITFPIDITKGPNWGEQK